MDEKKPGEIIVRHRPAVPTVLFDGECDFCRRWVKRWQAQTGDRVDYVAWQNGADRFSPLPVEALRRAVHLVERNGRVKRGAHAVFAMKAFAGNAWPLAVYEDVPWIARLSETACRFVADHRGAFNLLDLALLGRNTLPVTYDITRRWFLRLLSVVYLCAFISLWTQIEGLVGSRGILPIAPQLRGLAAGDGGTPYVQMPTLFWINASDGMLVGVCAAGVALSVMLMLRIVPVFAAFGAWFCYLSLAIAGQAFLAFQWDLLLLEAGFLAIFLAPLQLLPRQTPEPRTSRIIIFLYRWLLFRLLFLAGLVKILSADGKWRDLTALNFHYWTQPLPTPLSWYANLLPDWFQRLSVGFTLFAELLVPLFFFAPRQLRRSAFVVTIIFQILIMATGNYGFFNLLTIVLSLLLLDDTFWPFRKLRAAQMAKMQRLPERPAKPGRLHAWRRIDLSWVRWLNLPVAMVIVVVTTAQGLYRIHHGEWVPAWARETAANCAAFRSTNAYGLFEEMTERRPEIIIEWSDDNRAWTEFKFPYKPGGINAAPRFCIGHMPRLDWEMWFAGLEMEKEELPRWFVQFMKRILEGSPRVLDLLDDSPPRGRAPKYVRARVYFYRFTTWKEAREDRAWWHRWKTGFATGSMTLGRDGALTQAP